MGEQAEIDLDAAMLAGGAPYNTDEDMRRIKIRLAWRDKLGLFHRLPDWEEIPIEAREEPDEREKGKADGK